MRTIASYTAASPWGIVEEVLARFPASQAASALPVDIARPDDLLSLLLQNKRGDVAVAWLQRVLDYLHKVWRRPIRLETIDSAGQPRTLSRAAP